ncbi:MAG: hypothetical protein IJ043_11825 [Clostridia bacterium]|nr:hypothetical protein [Clostridia bacterium]
MAESGKSLIKSRFGGMFPFKKAAEKNAIFPAAQITDIGRDPLSCFLFSAVGAFFDSLIRCFQKKTADFLTSLR